MVPVSGRIVVPPLQYTDPLPWILSTIQTPATLVQGANPVQFIDARHREALQVYSFVRGFGTPLAGGGNSPSTARAAIAGPRFELDQFGTLVGASVIDTRLPFATRLVVPPQDQTAHTPPNWIFSFSKIGAVIVTTPPLGGIIIVPPQEQYLPVSWLWNWTGAPLPPPTRLPSGASTLVVQVDRLEAPPGWFWNWNGVPIIPGVRPSAGFQLIVPPQEEHLPFIFVSPGIVPNVGLVAPPGTIPMPNLVGLYFWEAEWLLKQLGILNLPALGYFGVYPISFRWVPDSGLEPFYVTAQSLAAGLFVKPNTPFTLTIQEPPEGVQMP